MPASIAQASTLDHKWVPIGAAPGRGGNPSETARKRPTGQRAFRKPRPRVELTVRTFTGRNTRRDSGEMTSAPTTPTGSAADPAAVVGPDEITAYGDHVLAVEPTGAEPI